MNPRIIETNDGSHTLYREDIDETYHSRHGALSESEHIFIKHGLGFWIENHGDFEKASILEIGFGTGLNAALTLHVSKTLETRIIYITIEPFPVELSIVQKINYFEREPDLRSGFNQLHELAWMKDHTMGNFLFHKQQVKIEDFRTDQLFDIVYFDAFAPEKQPEIWGLDIIQKVYSVMRNGGVLTTYCAKGEFKRNLKKVGFEVFTLPGPTGGKREMVRGVKIMS